MTDLPQKLSVLRRMLGKTQKTIAADVGVKQETVSKWELKKMPIPTNRIDALAQSLECNSEDFRTLSLAALTTKLGERFSIVE